MGIVLEIEKQLGEYLRSEGYPVTIKFLDKRLCEMGDLLIKSKTDTEIRLSVNLLKQASANWPLQVERVSFSGNVMHVWFERVAAYRKAISAMEWKPAVMKNRSNRAEQIYIEPPTAIQGGGASRMTYFRANALSKFMKNCFTHAGYSMLDKDQLENMDMAIPVEKIMFIQKKNKITSEQRDDSFERQHIVEILIGPVLIGTDLADADDYVKRRSNEMQLIAQHRYGVRIRDINELERIVTSLGRSAAIVDVLQQKHSSTIDMRAAGFDITRTPTASKGAAFILYNFARLASIFKKYRQMVEREGYPRIPPLDEVDFSVLTEADEWQLLYVYVIGFPAAMRRTLGDGQSERIAPHHLLEYTFGLVSCLSKYYRSTRILTDNRPKLLPVMVARLHLLDAIFNILQTILNLLELEPIEEM